MKTKEELEEFAKDALRTLGKEELLFTYHSDVIARPAAYVRLAELIQEFYKS
jgi:hypothetical protein